MAPAQSKKTELTESSFAKFKTLHGLETKMRAISGNIAKNNKENEEAEEADTTPFVYQPSGTPDLFLTTIPAEIRNYIYELALPNHKLIKIFPPKPTPTNNPGRTTRAPRSFEPGLLSVNKQIRHEAASIFYPTNYISILTPVSSLPRTITWLEGIRVLAGPKPFAKFRLALGEPVAPYPRFPDFAETMAYRSRRVEEEKLDFEAGIDALWPLALYLGTHELTLVLEAKGRFPDMEKWWIGWGVYGTTYPNPMGGLTTQFLIGAVREIVELGNRARGEAWGVGKLREVWEAWAMWKKAHPKTRARLNVRGDGVKWGSRVDRVRAVKAVKGTSG